MATNNVTSRNSAIVALFVSSVASAQIPPSEPARAEQLPPVTAWRFTPGITVTETYTDNAALAASALARTSWITESTPGIRIEKLGVRSKFYLDYRLHDFRYSGNSQLNNTQRLLTSSATVEAVDNWLFVDANANITQENRSAFSIAGATSATGANGNRVETTTNQISPYIRGRYGDLVAYQLRFAAVDIRANDIALPDTNGKQWTGFAKSQHAAAGFGWSLGGNALSFRNRISGKVYDERIRGTVSYEVNAQVHVSAIGGGERTNFAGVQNDRTTTSGFGLEWSPDVRTQLAAVREKRFFGNSQSVSIKHRTALSAWSFTNSKDVSAPSGQLTATGLGSTAGLLSDLLAASIPDPVARDAAVRQRLEDAGLSASSASNGGFATARPFLIRSTEASVALRGVYNTITLSATRTDQRGLGLANVRAADSFALSNEIRQQGINLNWAYRLSPLSTASFVATSLRSEGLSTAGLDSNQRSIHLLLSTR
ncbi:MAG: TIGR03016 family PEP-CTERM system-associated outer membrane protein, partial [Usitatibacteraceae bacterium]